MVNEEKVMIAAKRVAIASELETIDEYVKNNEHYLVAEDEYEELHFIHVHWGSEFVEPDISNRMQDEKALFDYLANYDGEDKFSIKLDDMFFMITNNNRALVRLIINYPNEKC